MTQRKRRQVLTVRVEYEPNRFSCDTLQKAYQTFSPAVSVSVTTSLSKDDDEMEQESDSDALRPPRSPQ